ncbi:hypothetical protein A4X09_0g4422 [Tilletia walkeri]|uniref:Uncharacterized protein n=1 Tax=Tilletia walkeri TaxID=117179 RepID=A0A8X7N7K6_9BASI|nr:hypothetical protein A4X09_0g4422 [Tilletia walkeri]
MTSMYFSSSPLTPLSFAPTPQSSQFRRLAADTPSSSNDGYPSDQAAEHDPGLDSESELIPTSSEGEADVVAPERFSSDGDDDGADMAEHIDVFSSSPVGTFTPEEEAEFTDGESDGDDDSAEERNGSSSELSEQYVAEAWRLGPRPNGAMPTAKTAQTTNTAKRTAKGKSRMLGHSKMRSTITRGKTLQ